MKAEENVETLAFVLRLSTIFNVWKSQATAFAF